MRRARIRLRIAWSVEQAGIERRKSYCQGFYALQLAIVLNLFVSSSRAATAIWTGNSSHLWTDAGNWTAGAPNPGDNLSFGSAPLNTSATNDYPAGTTFGNIGISEGSRGYTLGGNRIVLTNGFNMSGSLVSPQATVACDITVGLGQTWSASRSVAFTGNIDLNFPPDQGFALNTTARITFNGMVSTEHGQLLTLINSGTVVIAPGASLRGTNRVQSTVNVMQGTLRVDGSATNDEGSFSIQVSSSGTLAGTGAVDKIFLSGGTISPGDGAPGILQCSFASLGSGTLFVPINGPALGTDYSQLAASSYALGCPSGQSLTLNVLPGYTPKVGDSFAIINGQGSGTFYNLPYDSIFDVTNGYSFSVTYSNGVTLTTLRTPASPFVLWKGSTNLYGNRLWSSPDSWAAGIVPTSGSRVQFTHYQFHGITNCSALLPSPPQTNDLAPGTTVASLLFTDTNYIIYGNALGLSEGITNASGGSNACFVDLVPTGPLVLESDAGATLMLSGGFDGSGTIHKQGGGVLRYTGTTMNSFVGSVIVDAGALQVDGSFLDGSFVVNGGVLGGTGTVSSVTMNAGTLSPGDSPGILHIQGNLTMTTGAVYQAELNSPVPGSGYDQVQVNGAVSLNGATLNLQPGYNAGAGTAFLILVNQGNSPITGTFAGLLEGAIFAAGGQYFSISYKAGPASNEALVTRVNPPGNFTGMLRLSAGSVQLQGLGGSNVSYIIQANTNLISTNWLNIATAAANGSGLFSYTDTNVLLFPQRFFRIRTP